MPLFGPRNIAPEADVARLARRDTHKDSPDVMDDTFKWSLIALFVGILTFLAGVWLGIDWTTAQVSMLSFLRLFGELLILFTGSAAAVEIAKYFRKKNRLLEREEEPGITGQESRLREWMSQSLAASITPLQESVDEVRAEIESMEQERASGRYGRSN